MSKPSFQATADRRLMEGYANLLAVIFTIAWCDHYAFLDEAIWCFGQASRNQRFAAIGNPDKRGE